jgi:hypothetical protein
MELAAGIGPPRRETGNALDEKGERKAGGAAQQASQQFISQELNW